MTFEELLSDIRQAVAAGHGFLLTRDDAQAILDSFDECSQTPVPYGQDSPLNQDQGDRPDPHAAWEDAYADAKPPTLIGDLHQVDDEEDCQPSRAREDANFR